VETEALGKRISGKKGEPGLYPNILRRRERSVCKRREERGKIEKLLIRCRHESLRKGAIRGGKGLLSLTIQKENVLRPVLKKN